MFVLRLGPQTSALAQRSRRQLLAESSLDHRELAPLSCCLHPCLQVGGLPSPHPGCLARAILRACPLLVRLEVSAVTSASIASTSRSSELLGRNKINLSNFISPPVAPDIPKALGKSVMLVPGVKLLLMNLFT